MAARAKTAAKGKAPAKKAAAAKAKAKAPGPKKAAAKKAAAKKAAARKTAPARGAGAKKPAARAAKKAAAGAPKAARRSAAAMRPAKAVGRGAAVAAAGKAGKAPRRPVVASKPAKAFPAPRAKKIAPATGKGPSAKPPAGAAASARPAAAAKPAAPAKAARPAKAAAPARAAKAVVAAEAAVAAPAPIVAEVAVAAKAAEAWARIATPAGLASWLGRSAAVEAKKGGPFRVEVAQGLALEGRVAAAEKGKRLAVDLEGAAPSRLALELDALPGATTRVRVRHEGHPASEEGAAARDVHHALWGTLLRNLKSVLEAGLDRRHVGRVVQRTTHVIAPPARVWRALTDPADLSRWMALVASLEPREGGRFRFEGSGSTHAEQFGGGQYAEGVVVALEPERRLELAYRVPKFEAGSHPTLVAWGLTPEGDGTRLELAHVGFDIDPVWDEFYAGHRECWDIDLDELVALCERGKAGKVLRCELVLDPSRAVGAFDALAAAIGGHEVERGGGPEGRYVVFASGRGAAIWGVGQAGRYPRVRALLEPRDDELRLVVTETHLEPVVDEPAAYARWKGILAPLAQAGTEVKAGSAFTS
jgi:uncharacterized protein YndB with AHSA1/START domain